MTRRRFLQLLFVVSVAGRGTPSAAAGKYAARPASGDEERAAAAAQRATGGTVLSVKRAGSDYRVRVLTPAGRVTTVRVDAKN